MKVSWRTEALSWCVIAAMFATAAWAWNRVPDRIPVHWNAAGEVDGYGGRFAGLLLLPLVTLGMQILFLVLPAVDPWRANYAGFAKAYAIFRTALVAFLGAVFAATTLVSLGHHVDMARVIAVAMGLLFIVLGAFMRDVRPNWFVGIRNPWTLSSRRSWEQTHRLAGWLFAASGAATLVCGIVRPTWGVFVMLGTILPGVLVMTVYSYLVWRGDPERVTSTGVDQAGQVADRPRS